MKKNIKARESIGKGGGVIDHYIYTEIVYRLLNTVKLRIRPEIVAGLNLAFMIFFCYILIQGNYRTVIIFASLYILYPLRDILDGALARYWKMTNIYGIYLDSVIDVISETILILGLCIYFGLNNYYFLIVFLPLLTAYTLLQERFLFKKKEKQLNILDYLPLQFSDLKQFILTIGVIGTRNDTRKIVVCITIAFNLPIILFGYFSLLYILALGRSINSMIQLSKPLK